MKKLLLSFLMSFLISGNIVSAQEEVLETSEEVITSSIVMDGIEGEEGEEEEEKEVKPLEPLIIPLELSFDAPQSLKLLENGTFDASRTFGTTEDSVFRWNFGEYAGDWIEGSTVEYAYESPGIYKIQIQVQDGERSAKNEVEVYVYEHRMVMFFESEEESLKYIKQKELAAEKGVQLEFFYPEQEQQTLDIRTNYREMFDNSEDIINEVEVLIFIDNNGEGLNNFAQHWKNKEDSNINDKTIFQIVDGGEFTRVKRIIQPTYSILGVDSILLTRKIALPSIYEKGFEKEEIQTYIQENDSISVVRIDKETEISWWTPLSKINNLLLQKELPIDLIVLLISIPIIGFVIAFMRQFVGVSTFGVYSPMMLAMSFLAMGLTFGLAVFLVVMVVSYVIRIVFERVELMYVPKVALLLSVLSLSFFLLIGITAYFGWPVDYRSAIFPMMMITMISEKFLNAQDSSGMRSALIMTGETLFVALVAFLLIDSQMIRNMLVSTPEMIVFPFLGMIWLGKFAGLRLSEYFKFKALLNDDAEEE